MGRHLVGIDVGTGSARAAIFDGAGRMLAAAKRDITVYRAAGVVAEQSSEEIWAAVCSAVRETVALASIRPADIQGIGFDATCSLVVLGDGGVPVAAGLSGDTMRNIILWMDHRATDQARRINEAGHPVLRHVGDRISPEMETPKLLWLKENLRKSFDAAWQFFDLTDYLTWRATGSLARSACTVTCKWTYLAHERRWDASYFRAVGLEELPDEGFARIGQEVVEPGVALGNGLTERAARELGLIAGIPVGAGLIDAHAGGLATVGAIEGVPPTRCLGYVFGTSSCTMTTTKDPVFVPGVWGPYFSAMVPGFWLNEGGQSAAGAAIDHLIRCHPAATKAETLARADGKSLPEWLADAAIAAAASPTEAASLAGRLHVVPEFLGNRAPFADPEARAVIAGLGMGREAGDLVALYMAGLCGIGYGLRQIVEAQAERGAQVDTIVISGGAGRYPLIRQILADATGVPVASTSSEEPVLLGAAILGAVAAKTHSDVRTAMKAMSTQADVYEPATGAMRDWHEARFRAFGRLQEVAREIAALDAEVMS